MGAIDRVYVKPSPRELEARFLEVLADERLRGIGHWELNDRGEIIVRVRSRVNTPAPSRGWQRNWSGS
jgi:hypothetical protein